MESGVYKIENVKSGKKYIGSSKNLKHRLHCHQRALSKGSHHNAILQRAWDKYGAKDFVFKIMLFCAEGDLLMYEQLLMDYCKSYERGKGYNVRVKAESNAGILLETLNKKGHKYNRLTFIERYDNFPRGTKWRAVCDCGKEVIVHAADVRKGHTKSCGCYNLERLRLNHTTHNKRSTNEYGIWCKMKEQCYKEYNKAYKHFGAVGIKVCDRWLASFDNFIKDVGERPKGKILGRTDTHGDFSPDNCKWVTRTEQARKRRNTQMVAIGGRRMGVGEAEELLGVHRAGVAQRARKFKETYQQATDHFAKKKGLM